MKKLTMVIAMVMISTATFVSSCSKSSGSGSTGGTVTFNASGTDYSIPVGTGLVGHNASGYLQFVANSGSNTLAYLGGSEASGTYGFSAINSLTFTQGSKSYTTSNGSGTYTGNFAVNISGSSATATFSTILYNGSNPSDSLIITNGKYSGSYMTTTY